MLLHILIFLLILYCWVWRKNGSSKKFNLPKGPKTFPIFGNLFQVIVKPHKKFSDWAYKYGNIFTVFICGKPAVVVNDIQTMKQVFGTLESTGKFKLPVTDVLFKGKGISNAEGIAGNEIRVFTMRALRDLGFFRSSVFEPTVLQECEKVICWLESHTNSVLYPVRRKCIQLLSNISWKLFNQGSSLTGNHDMGEIVADIFDAIQINTKSGLMFLPWLKYVAPEWTGYNKLAHVSLKMQQEVQAYFDECKLKRQSNKSDKTCENIIDAFIEHWEICKDANSAFYGETGWDHCFYTMILLIMAAGETTATTLNWAINYLIAYPQIQQKLHKEIRECLGTNDNPKIMDRSKLPYLDAFILETLRASSFIPFGVIHTLLDDVEYKDYLLPKNTILIANIYHANYNKSIWGDPENFRPERFSDVEGTVKSRLKECIASFQEGRRMCPGESLAKDELFLTVAKLVQKFEFQPAPGRTCEEYKDPEEGYFLMPKQIGIVAKIRNGTIETN